MPEPQTLRDLLGEEIFADQTYGGPGGVPAIASPGGTLQYESPALRDTQADLQRRLQPPEEPPAVRPFHERRPGAFLALSLIPGFNQGYTRELAQQRLNKIEDRQQLLARFQAIRDVYKLPVGTVRRRYIEQELGLLGVPTADRAALAQENEQAVVAYERYLGSLLKAYPEMGLSNIKALLNSGTVSLADVLLHGQKLDQAADLASLRDAQAQIAGLQGEPTTTATPPDFHPPMLLPTGGQPEATPNAQAVDDEVTRLAKQRRILQNKLVEMRSEQGFRNLDAALKSVDAQIERLTGVTGGFTQTVQTPNGQLVAVRFNGRGEAVSVLGRAPGKYAVTEVGGRRVLLEETTGQQTDLGASQPATLEERLAAAAQAFRENPNNAQAQRAYGQAQEAYNARLRLAVAGATGKQAVPEKASPAERERIAEDLATLGQVERLASLYKPEYVGPLKGAIGAGKERAGGITKDEAAFRSQVAVFRNATIKAITGAAMSEPEAKRIRQQIPDVTNPSQVFEARMAQTYDNLRRMAEKRRETLAGTGVDLSGIGPIPAAQHPLLQGGGGTQIFTIGGKTIKVTPVK